MISLPSFPAAFVRGGGGSREIVLRSSETDIGFVSSSSRVPLSSRCRLSLVCLRRRGEGERGSAPSLRRRRGRRITSFAVNAGTTPKSTTFDANDRYARTANPFYEANCERYVEKILVKEATFAIDHTGGLSLLLDMCKIWREWSQTVSLVQLQLDDI